MLNRVRLTVAEYFAGIGLMRLGLDQGGWETVFANDIDEKNWRCIATILDHRRSSFLTMFMSLIKA